MCTALPLHKTLSRGKAMVGNGLVIEKGAVSHLTPFLPPFPLCVCV